jgi:hypothetical protein
MRTIQAQLHPVRREPETFEPAPETFGPAGQGPEASDPAGRHPVHRGIVAVMVEHEARRTNPARDELRRETYRLLDAALTSAGILPHHRDEIAYYRDGLIVPIRPVDEVPKTLLIGSVVPFLNRLVADRNAVRPAGLPELRLRVVVHSGEVHRDAQGFFGESLDIAFRLLDAPRVKEFSKAIADPVVLVISEDIYWSIVRHGYDGIDRRAFVPLVRIHAGRRRQGYVHVGSWRGALADSGVAPS